MEQYTDIQYDDDLTDGNQEYDDSYYTGAEDLFGFTPDEESPISRLKSLVLSIDWEITDEVLVQFNEELVDLRDIWAGEKINLVYVQALEKISKYIYQKKADAHPSAIKLLLTLYYNLERIVSSDDLSDIEKKEILLEDVKRFESLKSHLKTTPDKEKPVKQQPVTPEPAKPKEEKGAESVLINLKAIVLGIDWEITDEDLNALRKEVVRLESLFSGSRPRLILLQGIGTIGAYIKVKKSNAHADAFKVLHLFYDSLEKIVDTPVTVDEEKAVLFPAVERFNEFKKLLGSTISPESIAKEDEPEQEIAPAPGATIMPAFSDIPEDEIKGFQADEEAAALGIESPDKVNSHVTEFFGEDDEFVDTRAVDEEDDAALAVTSKLEAQFDETNLEPVASVSDDIALQGVDVEEGDEEEDGELVGDGLIAFASDEESPLLESEQVDAMDESDEAPAVASSLDDELESQLDETAQDFTADITEEIALAGVDVEAEDTEEDVEDDSAIAFASDELFESPVAALSSSEEIDDEDDEQVAARLSEKLETQFGETAAEPVDNVSTELALQGVNVEEDDDEEDEELNEEEFIAFESDILSDSPAAEIEDSEEELTSPVAGLADVLEDERDEISALPVEQEEESIEITFPPEADDTGSADFGSIDKEAALQGVDVESEADDDSDEEALPLMAGELAPALADNEETSIYNADKLEDIQESEDGLEDEIADTVLDFFGDEDEQQVEPVAVEEPELEETLSFDDELDFDSVEVDEVAALTDSETTALDALEDEESAVEEEAALQLDDEDFSTDIESQLDDFFGVDDTIEDADSEIAEVEKESESLVETAVATAASIAAAGVVAEGIQNLDDEEEVVFELVEEDEPLIDSGAEQLSGEASNEEIEDSLVVEEAEPKLFGNLGDCIDAVGVELEDKVLSGLLEEIQVVNKQFDDQPTEKTFLQLLKTVAAHIDRYRYESGSEAYSLLKSVYEAMSLSQVAGEQKQDLLLAQAIKVLNWQQDIIANQTEKSKDSAALSEPLFVQELGGGSKDEDLLTFEDDLLSKQDRK